MKPKAHFLAILIALAALPGTGAVANDAAPPPVVAPANVQLQIQGGQIQLQPVEKAPVQIQGAQFRIQVEGGNIRVVGNAAVAAADAKPRLSQPPAILFPIFPFHVLPHLTFEKEPKPGYLGVQLEVLPGEEGEEVDPKEKEQAKKNAGVGILEVMEDSPAAKAGIKEGDRVLAVEGKAVKDSKQLRELIQAAKADSVVKLTVRREEKEIEVKAKLGAFPEPEAAVQLAAQNGAEAVPGTVVFNRAAKPFIRPSTGTTASGAQPAKDDLDAVSLRDGNRFLGRVLRIDQEKGLVLQRESGPELELTEEGISSVAFAGRETETSVPARVNLHLRDGSFFAGEGLTMEGGKIRLTLHGGQRLEFPREQALSATLSEGQAAQIYEGPVSLAGWSSSPSGQGSWDYKDGYLRCLSNGQVGRNFERMPDPLDLSFEVLYPPQLHHFGISLFGLGSSQSTAGSLTVQFSPNQISANHFDGRRYNRYSVQVQPADRQFGQAAASIRYRLLVDRVNGRALVYVNGARRADWKLSKVNAEDLAKCGAFFGLTPSVFTSEAAFRVGRIRVLPWDGKEPAKGEEPPEPKTDQVLRSQGPPIDAPLERITEKEIIFGNRAPSAPRGETLHVRFATPPAAPAEPPPSLALLRLKNGSEFTVTALKGSGTTIHLTTRAGSQIPLPLSMLRDLEFLPRAGQPDVATTGIDVLTLTDGTQLKGALFAPIDAGRLRWKIAAAKTPLDFQETEIAGILFSPAKGTPKTSPLRGSSAVLLGNGDWLPGEVVSLDANQLVLKNELAPEFTFPISELRSLYLSPDVTAAVADGATGPESWTKGWNPNLGIGTRETKRVQNTEDPWMYFDGTYSLKSTSRIGSVVLARKWPAYSGAFALNFEFENPGRSASYNLQLYNSKDERTFTVYSFGGRVNVYFNPSSARLNRFAGGAKRFQVDGQAKTDAKSLRMSVVLDRPARTFRVLLDDKEIGKIPFKPEEASEALDVGGIALTPMSSGLSSSRQNRVAKIWIAPWTAPGGTAPEKTEGQQPEEPAPQPANDAAMLPTIHLANGDEFTGKVEGIRADVLTANSEAGLLELPRERVAWLNFPGAPATSPGGFPRLRFHDRGLLSIQDLRIENDRVKCRTLRGHALEFPLNVVKEVVYRGLILK